MRQHGYKRREIGDLQRSRRRLAALGNRVKAITFHRNCHHHCPPPLFVPSLDFQAHISKTFQYLPLPCDLSLPHCTVCTCRTKPHAPDRQPCPFQPCLLSKPRRIPTSLPISRTHQIPQVRIVLPKSQRASTSSSSASSIFPPPQMNARLPPPLAGCPAFHSLTTRGGAGRDPSRRGSTAQRPGLMADAEGCNAIVEGRSWRGGILR